MKSYASLGLVLGLALTAPGCSKVYTAGKCAPKEAGQRKCIEEKETYMLVYCEDGFWIPNSTDTKYMSRFNNDKDCRTICDVYDDQCITKGAEPRPMQTPVPTPTASGEIRVYGGKINLSKLPEKKQQ